MAKQAGLGTFLGTFMDIIGYADDDRLLFRMNGTMCKKKWKRHPSFARQREAARVFGAASMIAAGIWDSVPAGMKRIMGKGAYSRLVSVCRMLVEEDGNVGDVDGFRGVDFSAEPELAALSLGDGELMRDEGGEMRVHIAAGFDERGRIKDESPAACLDGGGTAFGAHGGGGAGAVTVDSGGSAVNGYGGAKKRRFCVAEPWRDDDDPDFVVEHERLGTISAFREGLRALRAEMGRPVVRRRRVWVAVCEMPSVEWIASGPGKGGFYLVQRGAFCRLGKGSSCSSWVVDDCCVDLMRDEGGGMRVPLPGDWDESGKMRDESLGAPGIWASTEVRGMVDEAVREARAGSEGSGKGTGVFLVMVGLEVAEKRGRHWVRVPQMCRVRVTDVACLNQNLQDSPDLQDLNGLEQNLQDSLNLQNLNGLEQNLQDSLNLQNLNGLEQIRWLSDLQSRKLSGSLNCLGQSEDSQDWKRDSLGAGEGDVVAGMDFEGAGMVSECKVGPGNGVRGCGEAVSYGSSGGWVGVAVPGALLAGDCLGNMAFPAWRVLGRLCADGVSILVFGLGP